MAGSVHPKCVCPDAQCPRHGLCAACHTFHTAAGTLPKCERRLEAQIEAATDEIALHAMHGQGSLEREKI